MSRTLQVVRREIRELIPPTIFFLVVFHMLAMTQAVARGQHGVVRHQQPLPGDGGGEVGAFAIGFSAVIVLISALDRPKNRLVAENQQVMEELRAWMDAQPSP